MLYHILKFTHLVQLNILSSGSGFYFILAFIGREGVGGVVCHHLCGLLTANLNQALRGREWEVVLSHRFGHLLASIILTTNPNKAHWELTAGSILG